MSTKKQTGMRELFKYAGKHRITMVLCYIFSTLSAITSLLPFICIYYVIKEALVALEDLSNLDTQRLVYLGWLAVIFALVGFVFYYAALMCSHITAFNIEENMKKKVLAHLVKLPMSYFKANSSGKIRKIVDENTAATEMFVAHQLPDTVISMVSFAVMLIMLLVFDWRLGIISAVTILGGFIVQMKMMTKQNDQFLKKFQDSLEHMNKEAVEYVRGISVVKVFGQTIHSFKNFKKAIMDYKDFALGYTLSFKSSMTLFVTIINGAFFLLIPGAILLSRTVNDYSVFVLSFIFYVIFTPACAAMLMKMMYVSTYKSIAMEAVNRIDSLLIEKPLIRSHNPMIPDNHSIGFKNVTFTYEEKDTPAVKNVSFHIQEGKTIALVGPSGGGKSTIANLIPRFWDVDSGEITMGHVNIKDMDPALLMDKIAFVFQDSQLLKDSIYNNVLSSRKTATKEEVLRALQAAQCEDIINKLPEGMHTRIGAKGIYLSGGEKQRIAIARAILKDAPIIILDEATAFADPENEYKIQMAFKELTRNKTVIMIAHRLSTIKNVDRIYVINHGEIVESGGHNELMKKNGLYHHMWKQHESSLTWKVEREGCHV